MQDMDGAGGGAFDAAAMASGQESDASSGSRGRSKKKGKQEWKPFGKSNSLSPGSRKNRKTAADRRLLSVPRTRVMPVMKTPLKDILHKQREQEEDKSEHTMLDVDVLAAAFDVMIPIFLPLPRIDRNS